MVFASSVGSPSGTASLSSRPDASAAGLGAGVLAVASPSSRLISPTPRNGAGAGARSVSARIVLGEEWAGVGVSSRLTSPAALAGGSLNTELQTPIVLVLSPLAGNATHCVTGRSR
ncbi:hypothetical protein T492DRAFT_850088 [Pavlovales sp. CCMP2436]|nr:hypothetical protein T492DRAFT_850088 [Pavlovales sp. CCMP2436]